MKTARLNPSTYIQSRQTSFRAVEGPVRVHHAEASEEASTVRAGWKRRDQHNVHGSAAQRGLVHGAGVWRRSGAVAPSELERVSEQGRMMMRLRLRPLCVAFRGLHCSSALRGVEELLPRSEEESDIYTGRAWRASELRLKSFKELHQLWFVLLKEKNQLMTEHAAQKHKRGWGGNGRVRKVKESMARLKTVLRERQIVYEDTKTRLTARQKQWFDEQKAKAAADAGVPVSVSVPVQAAKGRHVKRPSKLTSSLAAKV